MYVQYATQKDKLQICSLDFEKQCRINGTVSLFWRLHVFELCEVGENFGNA